MQTYNQEQQPKSRTLSYGLQLIKQPPLHTVLETYQERNWNKIQSPLLPLRSPNERVIQGRFINWENKYISLESVVGWLREDESFMSNIGAKYLEKLLKKVEEGNDMIVEKTSLETLKKRALSFLSLIKKDEKVERDSHAPFLKINRIVGLMEKKDKAFSLLTHLKRLVDNFPSIDEESISCICQMSIENLSEFKVDINLSPLGKWHRFDTFSLLAPLFMALQKLSENSLITIDIPYNEVNNELREIRQLMERNPEGITVYAHRGNGATNKSMGVLIPQEDNRRINRCAENSPSAFKNAMKLAPEGSLDGIECDVFLSKDKVPILSHVEDVQEQLSTAMKEQHSEITSDTVIGDLDKEELLQVCRTEELESNFIALEDLLEIVNPIAQQYCEKTGRAFRLEVEMKGTKIKRPSTDNVNDMEKEVTRVISHFKKKYPTCPLNILMFNGHPKEVEGYAKKRMEKTALGALYTGLNVDKPLPDSATCDKLKASVDELRYMLFKDPSLDFTKQNVQDFIMTLVYGAESAPTNVVGMNLQPIGAMFFDGVNNYPKPLNDLVRLLQVKSMDKDKLKKIHFLSDYPANAPYFKRVVTPDDVEGAFNASLSVLERIEDDLKKNRIDILTVEKYLNDADADIKSISSQGLIIGNIRNKRKSFRRKLKELKSIMDVKINMLEALSPNE